MSLSQQSSNAVRDTLAPRDGTIGKPWNIGLHGTIEVTTVPSGRCNGLPPILPDALQDTGSYNSAELDLNAALAPAFERAFSLPLPPSSQNALVKYLSSSPG